MRIGALQKTTLLDFPGRISAVLFTQGCNFLCPYCHNPGLILHRDAPLAQADVLGFLTRRRRLLEGVVITGGEPTLQDDLEGFCAMLKSLGYAIKLDTNGSRPDVLRHLLRLNLPDYVAMDVKASPCRYPLEIAPKGTENAVRESIALLHDSGIEHEFRVPCVAPFITSETFQDILEAVRGVAPVFLQAVRLEGVLAPEFFVEKGRALQKEEMERLKQQADRSGALCFMR